MSALPPEDIDAMRGRPLRRDFLPKPVVPPPPDTTTRRLATCRCGQVHVICTGTPVRVSVCHCRDCQQRSGSAFSVLARFAEDRVSTDGTMQRWSTTGMSGITTDFQFCATCGSTMVQRSSAVPGEVAIPVGAFADPAFPPPTSSSWEETRHPWVAILGDAVRHSD